MYTAATIFFALIGSFAATVISVNTGTIQRAKQQQALQHAQIVYPEAASQKAGLYYVAVEEYYLIH